MYANDLETWLRLIPGMFVLVISLYFFALNKQGRALCFLVLGALCLRLAMISLDPLNIWDERFHALVAKNMMEFPFRPMLHIDPVLPIDYKDWTGNHVWLHKQPLFLWQMALSMKLFGVNEMALRLPSALMGTTMVYFIYEILKFWTKKVQIAYIAAFFFALSFFQLELTSARIGMDHNDICFSFYVTASFWAFCKFIASDEKKWMMLIGVFVGLAVLVKWLAGILVFGGWGLYTLLDQSRRKDLTRYLELIYAFIIAIAIAAPWQIYILNKFPVESAWEYGLNTKHFFDVVEGHSGTFFYHFEKVPSLYYFPLSIVFLGIGIVLVRYNTKLSYVMLAMLAVVYLFFSIVATKIPAFPYIVSSIIFGLIAIVLYHAFQLVFSVVKLTYLKRFILFWGLLLLGYLVLNPPNMANHRSDANLFRNKRLHNLVVYQNIPQEYKIIFNVKSVEDVDLMFYHGGDAYDFYPEKEAVDSLLEEGLKLAAFKNQGASNLPDYIKYNEHITILKDSLW